MVPHRRALQAIALAACGTARPDDAIKRFLAAWKVRFPGDWREFMDTQVYPHLSRTVEVMLKTTDFSVTKDYRLILQAARELKITEAIRIEASGSVVYLPPEIDKWRQSDAVRMFIDTCAACEVKPAQIEEDVRRLFGANVPDNGVQTYVSLFMDVEYCTVEGWMHYARCTSQVEVERLQRLRQEQPDFVRWKLGVPVALDTETVLKRLISDAYFTERLLKFESGDHGIRLTAADMTRVKMERETLLKGVKMLDDLRARAGSNASASEDVQHIRAALRNLQLSSDEPTFPTITELP